jgi:ABC-2 type transport system permease protein
MNARRFTSTVLSVAARNLRVTIVTPALSIRATIGPIIFLAAFAGSLGALSRTPGFDFLGDYTAFEYAFIALQGGVFIGLFSGLALATDLQTGFAERLLLAGDRRAVVAGYLVAALATSLPASVALVGGGLALGMDVAGGVPGVLGVFGLAAVACAAGSLWSMGIALRFRTVQAAPLMQMPIFVALFLTPVFVPMHLLNGWIHDAASVNPVTRFLEAGRDLVSGQPHDLALTAAIAAVTLAALGAWTLRELRRLVANP